MEKISVVIAMYRSELSITPVVEELEEVFRSMPGYSYELILVNDCGPDNVLAVAKSLAARNKQIKVVELTKNVGQENAMYAGFSYCTGDYIVNMDDDMQHPASGIPKMLAVLKERDMDVVIANFPNPKRVFYRRIGTILHKKMEEVMFGIPKDLSTNSFFIMRRFVRDEGLKYTYTRPHIYGVLFAITSRVTNVDLEHRERLAGNSNYNFRSLLRIWLKGFFSFSNKPLQFMVVLGAMIAVISGLVGLVLIVAVWVSPSVEVQGWTSTMVAIIFFSGMQLLSIGVLGEYVGRMYVAESKLPNFIVRSVTNGDAETGKDGCYEEKR